MTPPIRTPTKCPIWPASTSTVKLLDDVGTCIVESDRAGGKYEIDDLARDLVGNLGDPACARLTTWLVDQRRLGNQCPVVTQDVVKFAEAKRPLRADIRAERLLRLLADRMETIGSQVRCTHDDEYVYAWSESVTMEEIFYLFEYLEKMSWVNGHFFADGRFAGTVTVEGFIHIADIDANFDSSQAFVAMWFDDNMDGAFESGIKPAIYSAGYKPMRIDKKQDVNKIDDEIIAEIRRSKFLVADFTHGEEGARGGVYFEAGFAQGLGIPVIYTCREDMVDKLHFDTRQYAHIVWETPKELHDGLLNRILARIGEGPSASPAR